MTHCPYCDRRMSDREREQGACDECTRGDNRRPASAPPPSNPVQSRSLAFNP